MIALQGAHREALARLEARLEASEAARRDAEASLTIAERKIERLHAAVSALEDDLKDGSVGVDPLALADAEARAEAERLAHNVSMAQVELDLESVRCASAMRALVRVVVCVCGCVWGGWVCAFACGWHAPYSLQFLLDSRAVVVRAGTSLRWRGRLYLPPRPSWRSATPNSAACVRLFHNSWSDTAVPLSCNVCDGGCLQLYSSV